MRRAPNLFHGAVRMRTHRAPSLARPHGSAPAHSASGACARVGRPRRSERRSFPVAAFSPQELELLRRQDAADYD